MDADGLKELFAPFGAVGVKRMFGGYGIYADDLCFAICIRGEVFLKADGETQPEFLAAGSKPFVYDAKGGQVSMSYWRLTENAWDDADELKRWAGLGFAAARRAASTKGKTKRKKPR